MPAASNPAIQALGYSATLGPFRKGGSTDQLRATAIQWLDP